MGLEAQTRSYSLEGMTMRMRMNSRDSIPVFVQGALVLAAFLAPQVASAAQWNVRLGAQVPDCLAGASGDSKLAAGCQARQFMGFVPNEIWIHQNDSITWTHATDEGHTVTFLYEPQPASVGAPFPAAQQRPSGAVGCSAYGGVTSASGSAYDPSGVGGLQCVNSGTLATYGTIYTVNFPAQGNFKFTCLIHASMFGLVHVLDPTASLPYTQLAYNSQTIGQIANVTTGLTPLNLPTNGANPRVYTVGKVVATGGGWQYGSLFRFVDTFGEVITKDQPLQVRVGQTVEFTNVDPAEPHTITFGCPTDDSTCPIFVGPGGFVDTSGSSGTAGDGARYAVLNAGFDPADEQHRDANSKDEINSGLLISQAQDRATGISPLSGTPGTPVPIAQVSPTLNRFRVTFNAPGMYRWICELHDDIGMIGWVNVTP
jgi:plastocyanin